MSGVRSPDGPPSGATGDPVKPLHPLRPRYPEGNPVSTTLVAVLTNGRQDCITQMMASFEANVSMDHRFATYVIFDDSGDPEYRQWLAEAYPEWIVQYVGRDAQGYNAAMQTIWRAAEAYGHVFMVEDDFLFTCEINVADMLDVLDTMGLEQIVLLRQAWFGNEVAAGGLLPALEAMGHSLQRLTNLAYPIIRHRAGWSTNPNVFRGGSWVRGHPWPRGEGSEYRFGQSLFHTDPSAYVAYWGDGTEYVRHIGERKGFGY